MAISRTKDRELLNAVGDMNVRGGTKKSRQKDKEDR